MNNKSEQKSLKNLLNSCDIFDENAPVFSEYSYENLRRLLTVINETKLHILREILWRISERKEQNGQ